MWCQDRTVQKCPDGMWCCGASEAARCCSGPGRTKFSLPDLKDGGDVSSTARAVPSSTSRATSLPTWDPRPKVPDEGLGSGAKAGVGVGAALGALGIILVVWFLWRRKKRLNVSDDTHEVLFMKPELDAQERPAVTHELPDRDGMSEQHGLMVPVELETSTAYRR